MLYVFLSTFPEDHHREVRWEYSVFLSTFREDHHWACGSWRSPESQEWSTSRPEPQWQRRELILQWTPQPWWDLPRELEEAEAKNCREEENKTFNEWKRKEKSNYHFSPSLSIITVQFIGRVVGTHDQKKKS